MTIQWLLSTNSYQEMVTIKFCNSKLSRTWYHSPHISIIHHSLYCNIKRQLVWNQFHEIHNRYPMENPNSFNQLKGLHNFELLIFLFINFKFNKEFHQIMIGLVHKKLKKWGPAPRSKPKWLVRELVTHKQKASSCLIVFIIKIPLRNQKKI